MTSSGWHRIDDEEPPENVLVICQGQHGGMFLGYHVGCGYFNVPNARGGRYAVAWHPLPNPYKLKA